MRYIISYTLLFLLLVLSSVPSHATTNVGTAGAQFLKIGPGARVDSLGGAFGALADDVTSIYWNPAGISQLEKTSFSDTQIFWLADIRYNYLAFATPIKTSVPWAQASHSSTSLIPRSPRSQNQTAPGFGIPLMILQSHWRMPDNSTQRNLVLNSLSASTPNTYTSRSIGKVPEVWRLMSERYIIPVGGVYGSGMCFSNFGPEMRFGGPRSGEWIRSSRGSKDIRLPAVP